MENRDHTAIVKDILSVALEDSEGMRISQLMQFVDLTSHQAYSYITELQDKGMIIYNDMTKRYHTTPKGARYLLAINHLHDLLNKPAQ